MESPTDLKPENRRRHYWIEKNFQKRVLVNLVLLVVGTLVTAHLVAWGYTKLAPSVETPASNSNPLAGVDWTGMVGNLGVPLLITAVLGILFVLGFGLLYSHRIAGPLFNLKRMMHKVEHGDLNGMMHIRATDEFHDVQDAFNNMLRGLRQRETELRQAIESIPEPGRKKLLKKLEEVFPPSSPLPGLEASTLEDGKGTL